MLYNSKIVRMYANTSFHFQNWKMYDKYKKLFYQNMHQVDVKLGYGVGKKYSLHSCSILEEDFFWDAISKFGIEMDQLRKMNPSYDDLLEIHSELNHFGFSVKYLLGKQKSN